MSSSHATKEDLASLNTIWKTTSGSCPPLVDEVVETIKEIWPELSVLEKKRLGEVICMFEEKVREKKCLCTKEDWVMKTSKCEVHTHPFDVKCV